jgi:2-oxoglutarate ferredoxin oxidoreductase subunit delta
MTTNTITIKSRGSVTIDVETCKGCELCITACPPEVLSMSTAVNRHGYHYPQLHPGCTGCSACLFICPDFVFEIFKFGQPVLTDVIVDDAYATTVAAGVGEMNA